MYSLCHYWLAVSSLPSQLVCEPTFTLKKHNSNKLQNLADEIFSRKSGFFYYLSSFKPRNVPTRVLRITHGKDNGVIIGFYFVLIGATEILLTVSRCKPLLFTSLTSKIRICTSPRNISRLTTNWQFEQGNSSVRVIPSTTLRSLSIGLALEFSWVSPHDQVRRELNETNKR